MAIVVQNQAPAVALDTSRVTSDLERAMTYLDCAEKELSLVLADDRLLHELNRDYRFKDRPTNVLAFPQEPVSGSGPTTTLLGDVIVSLPTAAREAQDLDQPVEARVLYLCLHGLLHLLGYDHEGEAGERDRMEALEQDLLLHLQTPG